MRFLSCLRILATASVVCAGALSFEERESSERGLTSSLSRRQRATAPPGFDIIKIGVLGTGCPTGSASYSLSGDKESVSISFQGFTVKGGPGVAIDQNRKNCQVTLSVKIPTGFSFGISTVESNGFYELDRGVGATQRAYYYFQSQSSQATAASSLTGPIPGASYTYRDGFSSGVKSGCGGDSVLNLNTELIVDANTGSGTVTRNSQNFVLSWQKC